MSSDSLPDPIRREAVAYAERERMAMPRMESEWSWSIVQLRDAWLAGWRAHADSAVPSSHVSDQPSALSDRGSGECVRAPDGSTERNAARYLWLRGQYDRPGVFERIMLSKSSDGESWVGLAVLDGRIDAAMSEAVCAEPATTTASAPAKSGE